MKKRVLGKSIGIKSLRQRPWFKFGRFKLSLLFIMLILGVGFIFIYNRQFSKDSNSKVSICGEAVTKQYNESSNDSATYVSSLRKLSEEVQNTPNYEDDITCVFILYSYYANEFNATEARSTLESIKQLQSENQQINPSLKGIRSVDEMETFVRGLEHNESIGDNADGSG